MRRQLRFMRSILCSILVGLSIPGAAEAAPNCREGLVARGESITEVCACRGWVIMAECRSTCCDESTMRAGIQRMCLDVCDRPDQTIPNPAERKIEGQGLRLTPRKNSGLLQEDRRLDDFRPREDLVLAEPGLLEPMENCRNLLHNGSFEDPPIRDRSYVHAASIPGWKIDRGSSLEVQRNLMGGAAHGDQHVEIASSQATTISQAVDTAPGAVYRIKISYSPRPGNRDNRVELRWAGRPLGVLDEDGTGRRRASWTERTFNAPASSESTVLSIGDLSAEDGAGGLIDNIRVCSPQ